MAVSIGRDRHRAPLVLISMLVSVWLAWTPDSAVAQSDDVIWSEPLCLSNTPTSSGRPAIVSDVYGYVHVFWSEEVGGEPLGPEELSGQGNTIFYTRWDGETWTPPVDILFVPGDEIAYFLTVDIDAENRIHAVWTGQTEFYYSNALSYEAVSAHAWRMPIVIATDSARSGGESSIVSDRRGGLHVAYATRGDGAGIYHIRSDDGGETWGPAVQLSEPLDRLEKSQGNVRVIADQAGGLHAVWQTFQAEGFGQAIYYTRSIDGGANWDAPTQLRYRGPEELWVEWPYLLSSPEFGLQLIYTNGSNQGRAYRASTDGGQTWSEPELILSEMEGVNGYVMPLVDGSGQEHLIVNMRTKSSNIVGIYYARWLGDRFSTSVPVDVSSPAAPSAHFAAAAVRLGNELHVVYNQLRGAEIWHVRGDISSATRSEAAPLPTPTAEVHAIESADTESGEPIPILGTGNEVTALSDSVSESWSEVIPMAVGGGVVLVLLFIVAVVTRSHRGL